MNSRSHFLRRWIGSTSALIVLTFISLSLCLAGGRDLNALAPAPAKEKTSDFYRESSPVAKKFPDPAVQIESPAFAGEQIQFTTYPQMQTFIRDLAQKSPDLTLQTIGVSQGGLPIPLLIFSRNSPNSPNTAQENPQKPTVLMIGLQHGNEPAGGEAALALAEELAVGAYSKTDLLDRINVLIVPRANPDGAAKFDRNLLDGSDLNRDHLILNSPEAKALAYVFAHYRPDVVLDCHECSVEKRLLEKFGGLQGYDALIQYGTVGNLPKELTEASEVIYRQRLWADLEEQGFSHSWYFTTNYDVQDKHVSMGGVNPDTCRNVASLYNSISFLIETRGVGIGPAHFKRRVDTHLVAIGSMLKTTAENGSKILEIREHLRDEEARLAGQGQEVVIGKATPVQDELTLLDPETGKPKTLEVILDSALEIRPVLVRDRPYGYFLPKTEITAVKRLQDLGVSVFEIEEEISVAAEHYLIQDIKKTPKEDVRRNTQEGPRDYFKLTTVVEPHSLLATQGDFYIPLDDTQLFPNLVIAALEPEPQSGFPANGLISLPVGTDSAQILPLYRLPNKLEVRLKPLLQ